MVREGACCRPRRSQRLLPSLQLSTHTAAAAATPFYACPGCQSLSMPQPAITIGSAGRLLASVATSEIASTISRPCSTTPKPTCLPCSHAVSMTLMKNCEPVGFWGGGVVGGGVVSEQAAAARANGGDAR